jgi:hypothetical protein
LRQRDRIGEQAGLAVTEEARDLDFARLPPQLVPLLNFADHLKLAEGGIEDAAVRAYPPGWGCR